MEKPQAPIKILAAEEEKKFPTVRGIAPARIHSYDF
jgi:hypothetical protein